MELSIYPCPNKTRHYEIEAIQIPIVYNKYGDHDPDGLLYVLKKDAKRIRKKAIELFKQDIPQPCEEVVPLVIRANAGDWIEITLHNLFDANNPIPYFDYPRVPLDYPHKPSMRVSLNPQFLNYDPIISTALEALNGMWNPACGVFSGYSKRAACVNAGIYIIFVNAN